TDHHDPKSLGVVPALGRVLGPGGAAAIGRAARGPPRSAAADPLVARFRARWIGFGAGCVVFRVVPVGAPLPAVATHVVKTPGVRLEFPDRRREGKAVVPGFATKVQTAPQRRRHFGP